MAHQRRLRLSLVLLLAVGVAAGCEDDDIAGVDDDEEFSATLTGDAEVPSRDTPASGTATFEVDDDDGTVSWTITATNITNVTAAHIHGPAGVDENAGVIVPLFTGALNGTRSGTFTEADIDGQGVTTLAALLVLMRSGQTYVNVHTNDGVDPTNEGPGDFPGGEIRGQIEARGPKA